jgi:hypothetical protein
MICPIPNDDGFTVTCPVTYCPTHPHHPLGNFSVSSCTIAEGFDNTTQKEKERIGCYANKNMCDYGCDFLLNHASSVQYMLNDSSIRDGITPFQKTTTHVGCVQGNFSGKHDFTFNTTMTYPPNSPPFVYSSSSVTHTASFIVPLLFIFILLFKHQQQHFN